MRKGACGSLDEERRAESMAARASGREGGYGCRGLDTGSCRASQQGGDGTWTTIFCRTPTGREGTLGVAGVEDRGWKGCSWEDRSLLRTLLCLEGHTAAATHPADCPGTGAEAMGIGTMIKCVWHRTNLRCLDLGALWPGGRNSDRPHR